MFAVTVKLRSRCGVMELVPPKLAPVLEAITTTFVTKYCGAPDTAIRIRGGVQVPFDENVLL